ncbi:hypothetical protein [Streptomyces gilvosporeus]|uniref:hypothetical protein n=1 Tax=Streptomyces gilvosporeus TaxID=553510 RepID=UPI0013969477|nr:hypothetical protein [Streptomyces gilvosporeus]
MDEVQAQHTGNDLLRKLGAAHYAEGWRGVPFRHARDLVVVGESDGGAQRRTRAP